MKSARISISLRPELYEWVKQQAEKRQTSVSRCIEECVEDSKDAVVEEVKPYPIEDVIAEAKQARIERKKGLLPTFKSAEEMFKALGI